MGWMRACDCVGEHWVMVCTAASVRTVGKGLLLLLSCDLLPLLCDLLPLLMLLPLLSCDFSRDLCPVQRV
jgi:hypothetical protein